MFRFGKRPPPLRIKSVDELRPDFRPRWVQLRFYLTCGVLAAVLGFAVLGHALPVLLQMSVVTVLFCGAAFAMFPKGAFGFIGLIVQFFPALAIRLAAFETWLQIDLDYDERRR